MAPAVQQQEAELCSHREPEHGARQHQQAGLRDAAPAPDGAPAAPTGAAARPQPAYGSQPQPQPQAQAQCCLPALPAAQQQQQDRCQGPAQPAVEPGAPPQRYATDLAGIREAAARIAPHAHVTPVLTSATLDAMAGRRLLLKCEAFQKTGAFKFRGACNAVFSLSDEAAAAGVVTHSSGNHAAALAAAAALRGARAHIVMPRNAPRCKLDATRGYGGLVELCEPSVEAREAACARIQAATGATLVPPYNYGPVMAGQGTVALELLEQAGPEPLDAIVVPVSGGGLISGVAIAAKALQSGIVILAAEPAGANGDGADVAAAKAAGALVPCARPATIADGLQARLGSQTWPAVRDLVDDVLVVSEQEIVAAMRLCLERLKVVVEPSGAAALAGALQLSQHERWGRLARVGVVLSGGNVDLEAKGLWRDWLPGS